ncbi:hypothetical protein PROFUN_11119 [Planoprotostelium fungivorum]|uniref:Uncharacterized protein n=1 Tax=Planoprotostelium fungivorum TaxID=1890364 RepID=A0A2P6NAR5_9EUKA|nr:hypothetical protein PROFUN_11119 [Planoprotostelium fungivorum]
MDKGAGEPYRKVLVNLPNKTKMVKHNLQRQLDQEAEIDTSQELEQFHQQFLKELQFGTPSVGTTFTYACFLIKSPLTEHKDQGIGYLRRETILINISDLYTELLNQDPQNREYLYFLSVGSYTAGNYTEAKTYVQALLQIEPNNGQARELEGMILNKIKDEGLVGMALVGGAAAAVAVGGILVAALLKKR